MFIRNPSQGRGFYSYSFVDTDENGEVTRWETHVNSEYSDFKKLIP